MALFKTLEESLKTKAVVVIKERAFEHNGQNRVSIQARKAKGKRTYYVTQYENGLYSDAV